MKREESFSEENRYQLPITFFRRKQIPIPKYHMRVLLCFLNAYRHDTWKVRKTTLFSVEIGSNHPPPPAQANIGKSSSPYTERRKTK
jgi:hypothetical protein